MKLQSYNNKIKHNHKNKKFFMCTFTQYLLRILNLLLKLGDKVMLALPVYAYADRQNFRRPFFHDQGDFTIKFTPFFW